MRILLVHDFYRVQGGEETYVRSLTSLLIKNGHRVKLFAKDNKRIGRSIKELLAITTGLFRNPKIEKQLASEIERFKPDIVHFNNIFPLIGPGAYRVCQKKGVPVVQTVHSLRYLSPFLYPERPLTGFFYTLAVMFHRLSGSFKVVDAYLFPSRFAQGYYLKRKAVSKRKARVIPNFALGSRQRKQKGRYFVYVGLLTEGKGIGIILDAFSGLPEEKLVVVGETAKNRLPRAYARYPNIVFAGRVPNREVYRYLSGAHALICASIFPEVFPTVILEAFSCGVPAIVPDQGVYKEMVRKGKTGLFYKKGDSDDLKKAVKKISRNPQGYRKDTLNEYARKYTPDKYYQALISLYEELT